MPIRTFGRSPPAMTGHSLTSCEVDGCVYLFGGICLSAVRGRNKARRSHGRAIAISGRLPGAGRSCPHEKRSPILVDEWGML